jgi:multidrug efflux pump subunit AcrB
MALAVAGVAAFPLLPVAPLPQIDFPTVQVAAQLPEASPETMAATVAAAYSDTLPITTVDDFADTVTAQQISQKGVAQVVIGGRAEAGGAKFEGLIVGI